MAMGHRVSHIALGAAIVVTPFGVWTSEAAAQTFSIVSITPSGSAGTFVAGSSAVTITMTPSGSFSPSTNVMHTPALTYTVSLKCVDQGSHHCSSTNMVAVLKDTGTVLSTSRLGALVNFTESGSQSQISSSGSNPTTFTLGPLTATSGSTATRTGAMQVGFGVPLLTSGNTGVSTTRTFTLAVGASTFSLTSLTSRFSAVVWNPMSIGVNTNMNFGQVTAPTSGAPSTYTLTPASGLSASGGGATFASTIHSAAAFTVTGEGAQAFSLTVPGSFNMTATGGHTLTVTTATNYGGAGTLTTQSFNGSLGTLGSFTFSVGGVLPVNIGTASGTYTGNLIVSVQYN